MFIPRRAIALSVAATLCCSAAALAQKDKKQDKAQKEEVQNVVKLVDGVMAGETQPTNDLDLAWVRQDFLKAQGNKEYAPFIVTIDPSKAAPGSTLTYYWRVVRTGGETTDPANGKDNKKKGKKDYAYEDVSFVPLAAGAASPMRISRSFTVAAGTYDVYVVAKEPTPKDKKASAPKVSVLKQSVDVPDYWNSELNTSSVIIAQKMERLAAPLTPDEQADRPYAFGAMEIIPVTNFKFAKNQELSTFMLIYNAQPDKTSGKPDVTVEYNFYSKQAAGEKFFNKTNPQNLNAQTLPPQFDLAAGHQLQSGQAVPLTTFPEGDYRLEIKVTDKVANKSLTRDVNFTVTGS
ncbi:MAG: hypothetical protein ACM3SQ_09600 [Betaproteobacteria bacterium]